MHQPAESAPIRLLIAGSRAYPSLHLVYRAVSALPATHWVVSGGARGVDREAAGAARARGLAVVELRPDWSTGRGAGFARNMRLVGASDRGLIFWDGSSRGTKHTVGLLSDSGKPFTVYGPRGDVILRRTHNHGGIPMETLPPGKGDPASPHEAAMARLRAADLRTLSVPDLDNLTYDATSGEAEVWEDPEYPGIYHWRVGELDKNLWYTREHQGERSAYLALAHAVMALEPGP